MIEVTIVGAKQDLSFKCSNVSGGEIWRLLSQYQKHKEKFEALLEEIDKKDRILKR